jgi:hypothetical protein
MSCKKMLFFGKIVLKSICSQNWGAGLMKGNFTNSRSLMLACAVMEKEILQFRNGRVEFRFLDCGLHLTPENMAKAIQSEIDRANEEEYDRILLGYGLCSNGIVGVHTHRCSLIVPRVHDCITLFLGSPKTYKAQSLKHPGTYYLTAGWIEKAPTPISKYRSYAKSYNEKTARWILYEEMKHYTRIALVDTGAYPLETYRKISRQNAKFLGAYYQELKGSPAFFMALVAGPWEKDFLILEKGQSILQEMFLDL